MVSMIFGGVSWKRTRLFTDDEGDGDSWERLVLVLLLGLLLLCAFPLFELPGHGEFSDEFLVFLWLSKSLGAAVDVDDDGDDASFFSRAMHIVG